MNYENSEIITLTCRQELALFPFLVRDEKLLAEILYLLLAIVVVDQMMQSLKPRLELYPVI